MENKENMDKVKAAMQATAEKVRLGGEFNEGVMIDYTSIFGNKYEGVVIFKRPTMLDYIKMGALKSEYLRQAGAVDIDLVDNSVKRMAQVMATLAVVVVKCPEWLLNIGAVQEVDVLYHVCDRYDEWEESFRKKVQPADTGNSGATERA